MKINGITPGDNGYKSRIESKTSKVNAKNDSAKTDSVDLTGTTRETVKVNSSVYQLELEFQPRTEKLGDISRSIGQDGYIKESMNSAAEKIVDSSVVEDVVSEVVMDRTELNGERSEKIENVREQYDAGHYNDPAVRRVIADKLITALGLFPESE